MATQVLDLRAAPLDVAMPAGDSLTFNITVEDITQIPNPVWSGTVKDDDGNTEDFTCTPTASGCTVTLYPAQTRALAESSTVREKHQVVGASSVKVWRGRYDVQVAYDTGMVRTLLKGWLELEEDVTT
jgi:hypothetical protein